MTTSLIESLGVLYHRSHFRCQSLKEQYPASIDLREAATIRAFADVRDPPPLALAISCWQTNVREKNSSGVKLRESAAYRESVDFRDVVEVRDFVVIRDFVISREPWRAVLPISFPLPVSQGTKSR